MPFDAKPLLLLLKAGKADVIDSFFVDAFRYRQDGISAEKKKSWSESLQNASADDVNSLYTSIDQLIRDCLYLGVAPDKVADVFPNDFHAQLKSLLSKVIGSHVAEWRESSMSNVISPAKLIDFDWRVDTKTSSNHLSRMAVPTVLVEMKLQENPTKVGIMPGVKNVQFELSKEALATMLDGLTKIRDQLGSIK